MQEHRIHRLRPGRPLSLRPPAGSALVVAKGVAWLTSSTHPRDEVLQPGQKYVAAAGEHVVIESLGPAAIVAVRAVQPSSEHSRPGAWNSADWADFQPGFDALCRR